LQASPWPEDWTLWLAAARVNLRGRPLGPSFANYAMSLQAALDGVGVAMALGPYVEDDIAAGRLVAPFSLTVPKGRAWYLVYRPYRKDEPVLAVFRTWLRDSFVRPHEPSQKGKSA